MEILDTGKFLAKAALFDSRQVTPPVVAAWHEAIGHHDYADALTALDRHRKESSDYLTPAHINALVPLIRRERQRDGLLEQARRALPPPPIVGPPEGFREAAGLRTRPKPPPVACPWCGAAPGKPCTVRGTDKPMDSLHPSRMEGE